MGKYLKRIFLGMLMITLFTFTACEKSTKDKPDQDINQQLNTETDTKNETIKDVGKILDELWDTIYKGTGFSEETLLTFYDIEKYIYKEPLRCDLYHAKQCYMGTIYNLWYLEKNDEVKIYIDRWAEVMEQIYNAEEDVDIDFSVELLYAVEEFCNTCLAYGVECDEILLSFTQKIHSFYQELANKYNKFEGFYYSSKSAFAYALLLNHQEDESYKITCDMSNTENSIMAAPVLSYHHLLNNNLDDAVKVYELYIEGTKLKEAEENRVYKEIMVSIFDDFYQLKKRNIAVNNINGVVKKLSVMSILHITAVDNFGAAKKAGILENDIITKYNGEKVLSYNHFKELTKNADAKHVEIGLMREGKALTLVVPAGKLGIQLREDVMVKN